MTALWWIGGALVAYIVAAEVLYSRRWRKSEREAARRADRPPAPLPAEDLVARIYLISTVFVAGCFVGALLIRC